MRKFMWVAIAAAAVVFAPMNGFAQRSDIRSSGRGSARGSARGSSSNFNYQDISKRNTQRTEREARQKKEAEEAKKKAEEEKKKKEREERMKRWQEERDKRSGRTSSNSSETSGNKSANASKAAAKTRGPAKPASAPVTTGGSYDPTTRQVTEVMLDAVKTQAVKFDRASAADDPSIILLNKPRNDPAERKRAAEVIDIGQPL